MVRCLVAVWLGLQLVACAPDPTLRIVEISPSSVKLEDQPIVLRIEGTGFSSELNLALDNHTATGTREIQVKLGGVSLPVVEHPNTHQVDVLLDGFAAGSYDLELVTLEGRSATRPVAVTVLSAATPSTSGTLSSNPSGSLGSLNASPDAALQSVPSTSDVSDAALAASTSLSSNSSLAVDTAPTTSPATSSSRLDAAAPDPLSTLDASPDTETTDSGMDSASDSGVTPQQCQSAHLLFSEDYESGDLSRFTSADYGIETCQQTSISTDRFVSGQHAFKSEVTCSTSQDHEHYGALQFSGNDLLSAHTNSGTGIDSTSGVVISFWAWTDLGFTPGNAQWLSFLLLSGTCDWSDTVFSVATGNSSDRLAISHTSEGGGTSSDYPSAPAVPAQAWTHVSVYVNYYDSVIVVWQDGAPVTRADFVRPGTALCHIRIGAYVSAITSQVLMYLDDAQVWDLADPLTSLDTEPCFVNTAF